MPLPRKAKKTPPGASFARSRDCTARVACDGNTLFSTSLVTGICGPCTKAIKKRESIRATKFDKGNDHE